MITNAPEKHIYTVTQLNRHARQLLETHLSLLWIEGEISNFTRPASGHCYFTLKDAGAQIRCALFKNRSQYLRIQPKNGMKVLIRGRVSLYEGRGDYQLIAEHMEDAGLGALQRAFDELVERLSQEGLFDPNRKKAVPLPAKHVAIITSRTGAALRDILSVFKRRWPGQALTLIPVPVQGAEAAPAIVKAIELANQQNAFDVILLARGGGSLEDLWSFNEVSVAYAISKSKLPIVTGVGHETDTTIADYAADLRAPTPSAAAELLSPDIDDWRESFVGFSYLLEEAMERKIKQLSQRHDFASHKLARCEPKLASIKQQLIRAEHQTKLALYNKIKSAQADAASLEKQLLQLHPARQVQVKKSLLAQLEKRLHQANPQHTIDALKISTMQYRQRMERSIHTAHQLQRQALQSLMQGLHNLSPLQTLERGFSLISDSQQRVITNANQLAVGDSITARLHKGEIKAQVQQVTPAAD